MWGLLFSKLLGCGVDYIGGHDGKDELGQQHREEGVEGAEDGKDGGDFHKDDVAESQRDADGQMDADAATGLAAGDTDTDEGHDEYGEGGEQALIELDFGGNDGSGTAHLLAHYIFV